MTKKIKTRRGRILRKIVILLIVLALLGGLGLYGYSALKQEYTIVYDSYTASIGSISNSLSFSGNLNLVDSAIYAAESSSEVRKLYVSAGDDVKEGDKLVRLLNGETVEAEFDGRVNAVYVDEGDDVKAGMNLVQVADFEHMQVTLRVDEYDIADVAVGQRCTVTATATEKQFESEIDSIDYVSASGGNVAYYSALCYVDVDEGIYPGMQVTVSIPQEEAENVVVLKMDALSFDDKNSAFVYMYNEAGALEEVPVEVGVSNGNYVEIKSGVSDGDTVYVQSKAEEGSAMAGILGNVFGSERVNEVQQMRQEMFSSTGGGNGGSMPDFGGGGGGNREGNRGGRQMGGGRQ